MKFSSAIAIAEIASEINAELIGEEGLAKGINEIHKVEEGDITFVDHPKYYKKALQSNASFVIINKQVEERHGKTILVTNQPFKAYNQLVQHYKPEYSMTNQLVHPSASIGEGSKIYPGVFIGDEVQIGDNCIIYPNVSIYPGVVIGNNVIIHSNSTIGADAFYYKKWADEELVYEKMHTCGKLTH